MNPDSYREELRSRNKTVGFPITKFPSPLGEIRNAPSRAGG
jgi:hypothetical protein